MLLLARPATAQTPMWPDIVQYCPSAFSSLGSFTSCLYGLLEDDPVHLATNRYIAPGSGTVTAVLHGVRDFSDEEAKRQLTGEAAVSDRLFWKFRVSYELTPWRANEREPLVSSVVYRRLAHLSFFGLGPNAPDRSYDFAANELSIALTKHKILTSWARLDAAIGYDHWSIPANTDPTSVKANFTELTAPGINNQPHYVEYSAAVGIHSEPLRNILTLTGKFFEDISGTGASFFETDLVAQHDFPLGGADTETYGKLSGRVQMSFLNPIHNPVPFYMQPTLGGADINGQESLRGFQDYRFRGDDAAVAQVEYDHVMVKDYLHGFVFVDAGQVAMSAGELFRFASIRHDVGVGLSLQLQRQSWLRAYVAFGGGEGAQANLQFTMPVS